MMWQRYIKKTVPQSGTAFFLIFPTDIISVDFVDSNTRLGKLKASFRLRSLLI